MVRNEIRQDVRLQLYITPQMDDKLDELCELYGMRKNELVRMALGTFIAGYQTSVHSLNMAFKNTLDEGKRKPKTSPTV